MSFSLHVLGIYKLHFISRKLTLALACIRELHLHYLKLMGLEWCSVRMEKAKRKELAFCVPNLILLKPFVYVFSNLHFHVTLPFVIVLKIIVNENENKYIKRSLAKRIEA